MIDLNLVRVFVTIYEIGSVSAAAERLHVSQPSVSYTLSRLRKLLGEPLFTRPREGMTPTFSATQLYGKFRNAASIPVYRADAFAWRCPIPAKYSSCRTSCRRSRR
jgi:Bacterial regulatory helix-turn-helix protein, lysR family